MFPRGEALGPVHPTAGQGSAESPPQLLCLNLPPFKQIRLGIENGTVSCLLLGPAAPSLLPRKDFSLLRTCTGAVKAWGC